MCGDSEEVGQKEFFSLHSEYNFKKKQNTLDLH